MRTYQQPNIPEKKREQVDRIWKYSIVAIVIASLIILAFTQSIIQSLRAGGVILIISSILSLRMGITRTYTHNVFSAEKRYLIGPPAIFEAIMGIIGGVALVLNQYWTSHIIHQ